MVSYQTILGATLPVFLIMAAGFFLRRFNRMAAAADGTVITLAVSVTYPAYILRALVDNPNLREPGNVGLPVLCGVGFVLVGMVIGWLVAPLFGLNTGGGRRTFSLACSVQNYGYLPIPIMDAIFHDGPWKGVLFVYSLGIELAIWSVGVMLLSGDWRKGLKQAVNPVTGAIVIGLVLNSLKLDHAYPAWSFRLLDMLGNCAIPLGLLVAGATLADLVRQPGAFADWRTPFASVLLRLLLLPALMLGVAMLLPLTPVFRQVLAVQAAMPGAVFPIILARRYGGHEPTAVRVLVFTTAVSFFTIPAVVALALKWVQG